jgi:uncharacterized integral membrane protein (TIGR00698 family)
MSETTSSLEQRRSILHEDWAVVVVGFIAIFLSLLGIIIPAPSFSWSSSGELLTYVVAAENIMRIVYQFLLVYALVLLAFLLSGKAVKGILVVFPFIFVLSAIALALAGNSNVKGLGLESVIFSLILGLTISNSFVIPGWIRESLNAELFVKIGLVLLGTNIIASDILNAGLLGLVQALVVVVSVWYFAFWICRKLKVDEELTIMISSAVSICGVSAAIATAGAIKGDTKKLSYVISLVLVTAIPMMIFMPYIARYFDFPEEVTGAWLGGTIDTTGAVVASGTLVGETALKISTIVKFSQNVLLGIAAFVISLYWTYSSEGKKKKQETPTLSVIWERFPKFVLGFIAASVLFSFAVPSATVSNVKESLKSMQSLWFVIAFTSIGLETKFSDLFNNQARRPLVGFLIAQCFNVIITLALAFYLFG